jgi:beta-lactamase regulating signal transducer with metallopeptidase domain
MNALFPLLDQPWVTRLGWVLVHFLWQGAAIALLLALALSLLAHANASLRYLAAVAALLACALAPVTTWIVLAPDNSTVTSKEPAARAIAFAEVSAASAMESLPGGAPSPSANAEAPQPDQLRQLADHALPGVVASWFSGVTVLALRLALAWTFLQRLRLSGRAIADDALQERVAWLLRRMRLSTPVRVLESALVGVPVLIGWLRPVILLPATIFTSLTPDQLEAILAHELAHVRRHDYLVNLLQTLLETVLFYHPVVWWISRRIREERENCCDDIALKITQDRILYATALAQLEEVRAASFALAATDGPLLRRIQRLAGISERRRLWLPLAALALVALVLVLAGRQSLAEVHPSSSSASPPVAKESSRDARINQLYNNLRIEGLKFDQVPLDQFVQNLSRQFKANDPMKQGFTFVLNVPPGEKPLPITIDFARIPNYRANISMILGYLHNRYPIHYRLDGPVVYVVQIPHDVVAFNQKAAATLIDIDFHGADPVDALKFVQEASRSKGFAFDVDTKSLAQLDQLKPLPRIDLAARLVSVDQAIRSICYLADLHEQPMAPCTGYQLTPQSTEATRQQTHFQLGDEEFQASNLDTEEASLQAAVQRQPQWQGANTSGPVFEWQDANMNGPAFGKLHGQIGPMSDSRIDPQTHLQTVMTQKMTILDKKRIRLELALEIKDATGKSLGKISGADVVESGRRVWLTAQGKPGIVVPFDGASHAYVALSQATLVNEEDQPLLPWPGAGREMTGTLAQVETPAAPPTTTQPPASSESASDPSSPVAPDSRNENASADRRSSLLQPSRVTAASSGLSHTRRDQIMRKLRSIIIDKVDFKQLDVGDVIQVLTEKSKQFDPEHHGINFVLNLETPTHAHSSATDTTAPPIIAPVPDVAPSELIHRQITIKLENVSLYDVLASIVRQSKLQFAIDDYAVYLRPPEKPDPNLTVRAFLAPPNFLTSSEFSGIAPSVGPDRRLTDDPLDHDVKEELIARGIRFPAGATAVLIGGSGKLIVRDTPEQLDLIASLIEKESNSLDAPTKPSPNDVSVGHFALDAPPALAAGAPVLGNLSWPPLTRVALKIATIAERDYESHHEQIDDDLARGDIERVSQLRSFNLLSEPSALLKPGEPATLAAVRVFPYPVAFERVSGKLSPTNFEQKDIGVLFETSTETKNGVIQVTGKLSLTSFEGWTQTGEKTFSPTFRTCESYLFEEMKDGQTKGIGVPGLQIDSTDGQRAGDLGKIEPPGNRSPSRILLFLTTSTVNWPVHDSAPAKTDAAQPAAH